MAKKEQEGKCAVCGEHGRLSFEHVPPHSAFNSDPIFIQKAEHLFQHGSHQFGKRSRSNRGFGRHTLCATCNNHTGDWYARDFSSFVKQAMIIIKEKKDTQIIEGRYCIKPLNVLKQITTMFMSANFGGHLQPDPELTQFVLKKSQRHLPKKYRIYLYSTLSKQKRMMGMQVIRLADGSINKWSEINFQPFGYLLTEDSSPPNDFMVDITHFSDFEYGQEMTCDISTAYLKVSSPYVGTYDNVE